LAENAHALKSLLGLGSFIFALAWRVQTDRISTSWQWSGF